MTDRGEAPRAPSSVQAASTLLVVVGGITLLGDLLLLATARLGHLYGLLVLVHLVVGGTQVGLGTQLRQLLPLARSRAIVLTAFGLLVGLLLLSRAGGTVLVGMILGVAALVQLFRSQSKAAFPRSRLPLGI